MWCFVKIVVTTCTIQLSRSGRFCTKYLFLEICGEKTFDNLRKKREEWKSFIFRPIMVGTTLRKILVEKTLTKIVVAKSLVEKLDPPDYCQKTLTKILVGPTRIWSQQRPTYLCFKRKMHAMSHVDNFLFVNTFSFLFLTILFVCLLQCCMWDNFFFFRFFVLFIFYICGR